MDIERKNELKLIRKNAILNTLSEPLVICIIIAPIVFGLIFLFFLNLQKQQMEKNYNDYMTKPLEAKIEYIDLETFQKYKDGSRKITEIANRYKEAGYLVTINDNSMIVEKQ